MKKEIPQPYESESQIFKEAQRLAEEALERLKTQYGLTQLSNIEFVGLRKIAAEVLNELKTNRASDQSMSELEPKPETVVRFLDEFYGVHPDDFFTGLDRTADDFVAKYEEREQQMREYLRRKQAEMHHP